MCSSDLNRSVGFSATHHHPRFFGGVVFVEDERGSHTGGLGVGDLLGEPVGFFTINGVYPACEIRAPSDAFTRIAQWAALSVAHT